MKKVAILFISIVIFSISFANATNEENENTESTVMTTSLSGKVLDKATGEALVGVKLTIDGLEKSTYTDFDGNFVIDGIEQGTIELKATYISYKDKVETVKLGSDTGNSIELEIESFN